MSSDIFDEKFLPEDLEEEYRIMAENQVHYSDEEMQELEEWQRAQEAGCHNYRDFLRARDHEDECGDR